MKTFLELVEEVCGAMKQLRRSPEKFSKVLIDNLGNFKAHNLYHREGNVPLKTVEGRPGAENAISALQAIEKLPRVSRSKGLYIAAQEIANLISSGTYIEDQSLGALISRYGYWYGNIYQLTDEHSVTGIEAIQSLLIDDGSDDKPNRNALLSPLVKRIGIGASKKSFNATVIVILLATDFEDSGYIQEPVFPEDSVPYHLEIDHWEEEAERLDCEIVSQTIGEKNTIKIKQHWQLFDSNTKLTERIIERNIL
jgi:hypothetical protein